MGAWVLLLWVGIGEAIGEPGPGQASSLVSHRACCMNQGGLQSAFMWSCGGGGLFSLNEGGADSGGPPLVQILFTMVLLLPCVAHVNDLFIISQNRH